MEGDVETVWGVSEEEHFLRPFFAEFKCPFIMNDEYIPCQSRNKGMAEDTGHSVDNPEMFNDTVPLSNDFSKRVDEFCWCL